MIMFTNHWDVKFYILYNFTFNTIIIWHIKKWTYGLGFCVTTDYPRQGYMKEGIVLHMGLFKVVP